MRYCAIMVGHEGEESENWFFDALDWDTARLKAQDNWSDPESWDSIILIEVNRHQSFGHPTEMDDAPKPPTLEEENARLRREIEKERQKVSGVVSLVKTFTGKDPLSFGGDFATVSANLLAEAVTIQAKKMASWEDKE